MENNITLRLPQSFDVPNEYLETTPEENAAILLFGRSLLGELRKTRYSDRMENLQKELDDERAATDRFRTALVGLDEAITTSIDDAVGRSFGEMTKQVEELSRKALEHDRGLRDVALSTIHRERDATERRVASISSLIDRVGEAARTQLRVAGRLESSTKGNTNEVDSRQLIVDAFGSTGSGFHMHPKEDFSGDHMFDWNNLRIMWEDKHYTRPVPREEIEKAWRDLSANEDCNVLLFVSATSSIVGRENSSGLVSEVRDGKLILYLSNFKNNVDQIGYLRTVIKTILIATSPLILRMQELGPEVVDERLRIATTVLEALANSLFDQEKACDALAMEMRVRISGMKNCIERTRTGIDALVKEIITIERPVVSDVAKASRKCGKCGQPGHTRTTCKT